MNKIKCPHCGNYKIITKLDVAGIITLGGFFLIPLFGIGLIVMLVGIVYFFDFTAMFSASTCPGLFSALIMAAMM